MNKFRRPLAGGPILIGLAALLSALLFGVAVALLPPKLSVMGAGLLLVVVGAIVLMVMPDRISTPWRMVYAVFAVAVFTRFLWPNFAYIPIESLPTKNPQRAVWGMAVAYWAYSLATNAELRRTLAIRLATGKLAWLVFAFLTWRYISIGGAQVPAAGILPVLLETFEYLPALLFPLTWLRDERDAIRVARWLMFATLVVAAFTGIEYALKRNPFADLIPADIAGTQFGALALEAKFRGGEYRAQATFNHPLLLGQFMAAMVPLLFLVARADPSYWARRLAWLAIALSPAVMLASKTRTSLAVGLVVFAIAVLMVLLARIRPAAATHLGFGDGGRRALGGAVWLMVATACAVAAAAFIVYIIAGRSAEESVSSMARVEMAQRAFALIPDSPLLGFGPGQGGALAANVSSRGVVTLDSYWLLVMMESGLPALLMFIFILTGSCLRLSGLARPVATPHSTAGWWAMVVLAMAISSMGLGTPHNLPLLYLAIGVILAIEHPSTLINLRSGAPATREDAKRRGPAAKLIR